MECLTLHTFSIGWDSVSPDIGIAIILLTVLFYFDYIHLLALTWFVLWFDEQRKRRGLDPTAVDGYDFLRQMGVPEHELEDMRNEIAEALANHRRQKAKHNQKERPEETANHLILQKGHPIEMTEDGFITK